MRAGTRVAIFFSAVVCSAGGQPAQFLGDARTGVAYALFSDCGERLDTDHYWASHCVIYASVDEIRDASNGKKTMVLRPIGTLAGNFDAGKRRALEVPFDSHVSVKPGDTVVVNLFDTSSWYATRPPTPQYLLTDDNPCPRYIKPLVVVNGFSDPRVSAMLAAIQGLRRKPPLSIDIGAAYWQRHSLVYAVVNNVDSSNATSVMRFNFQILGTVSGGYDAGTMPQLTFERNADTLYFLLDEGVGNGPQVGERMLLLLRKDETDARWRVAVERAAFMPRAHDPIISVSSRSDPQGNKVLRKMLDGALTIIQAARRGERDRVASPTR